MGWWERQRREFRFGDLLTTVTVISSVAALVISWQRDYRARVHEEAQRARSSAAGVLRKLERYQALQLSIYDDVQPLLVEVSKIRDADGHPVQGEQIDRLYAGVKALRAQQLSQILEEDIGTAYTELLAYNSGIRDVYRDAFAKTNDWSANALEECALQLAQEEILKVSPATPYVPAQLGNALRVAFGGSRDAVESELDRRLSPLIDTLNCYIAERGDRPDSFQANVDQCDQVLHDRLVEGPSPLVCPKEGG